MWQTDYNSKKDKGQQGTPRLRRKRKLHRTFLAERPHVIPQVPSLLLAPPLDSSGARQCWNATECTVDSRA